MGDQLHGCPCLSELRRRQVALLRELECDVDEHVLLAADVAGLPRALEDLVGRDAVALGGVLGVQQERRVDAGPALHDRGAVGLGPARQVGPHHLLGRVQHAADVDAGLDAEVVEGRGEHLGRRVAGAGAERAQRAVDLPGAGLEGEHRVGDAEREVLVAVEADLRLAADLGHQRRDPRLGLGRAPARRPSRRRRRTRSRRRP